MEMMRWNWVNLNWSLNGKMNMGPSSFTTNTIMKMKEQSFISERTRYLPV